MARTSKLKDGVMKTRTKMRRRRLVTIDEMRTSGLASYASSIALYCTDMCYIDRVCIASFVRMSAALVEFRYLEGSFCE